MHQLPAFARPVRIIALQEVLASMVVDAYSEAQETVVNTHEITTAKQFLAWYRQQHADLHRSCVRAGGN